MAEVSAIIDDIETAEDATAAVACLQNFDHALTSKKETSALLKAKTTSLGLVWDTKEGVYKPKEKKDA
jgi:hypothetical protein